MKKKEIKTAKKLSLEKFKVAELKNPMMIIGGDVKDDGGGTGVDIKVKTGKVEVEV